MSKNPNVARWHNAITNVDMNALNELLHEDVIFHSPVVFTPVKGKKMTSNYLMAAFYVLVNDTFKYTRELNDNNQTILEFRTTIDGVLINGVDIIEWNDAGQIVFFKVMVRPLQGVHKIHQMMMAMLEQRK